MLHYLTYLTENFKFFIFVEDLEYKDKIHHQILNFMFQLKFQDKLPQEHRYLFLNEIILKSISHEQLPNYQNFFLKFWYMQLDQDKKQFPNLEH